MANELKCPICGNPTRIYMGNARKDRLCGKHADELKAGKIKCCQDCGNFYYADKNCSCKAQPRFIELPQTGFDTCVKCGTPTKGYAFCKTCWSNYDNEKLLEILNNNFTLPETDKTLSGKKIERTDESIIEPTEPFHEKHHTSQPKDENHSEIKKTDESIDIEEISSITIDSNNKYRCLVCGIKSQGLLFCPDCYKKYSKKKLLFSIQNCSIITLLDESYEGIHRCTDGHIVKSKSEVLIDEYLFRNHIVHAYEKSVAIDDNPEHDLHPDFYLIEENIYIEHWGFPETNIKYTQAKKYKIEKYKELGLTVICTTEKDMSNIDANLERKIRFCKKGEVNEAK